MADTKENVMHERLVDLLLVIILLALLGFAALVGHFTGEGVLENPPSKVVYEEGQ